MLIGPPGSGKGTMANIMVNNYHIPHITTGDLLREEVAHETDIGRQAKPYMDRGDLVPDGIVNKMVEKRLHRPDSRGGFILDGYPRNLNQAESLDEILNRLGTKLDCVLDVVVGEEELLKRLTTRRICPNCGAIYNLLNKPPIRTGICDNCGTAIIQRDDDREEIIRTRLEVYKKQAEPIIRLYRARGIMKTVRGDVGLNALPKEIKRVLES